MESFELFIGALLAGICVALIGLGYAIGQSSVADDCKAFGAFKHVVIYECKEKK